MLKYTSKYLLGDIKNFIREIRKYAKLNEN